DEHREGHHARYQNYESKKEAHAVAHDDQLPTGRRRQDLRDELPDGGWHGASKNSVVDELGGEHPSEEDGHVCQAQPRDSTDRRRLKNVESVPRRGVETLFVAPAQLI